MASPYLAVGAFPQLIRFLPKPGAWMDTFKHMMGFVMLGTIVFLFSFMDRNYLVATFAMMVGLWAGCWWIGRTSLVEPLPRRLMAWTQGGLFAALIGLSAFTWLTPHASIIPWKAFSPAELARLNGEGQTVMVDFTAEWCANCKFNLYHSIETKEVLDLLNQNKVVPLLADWTTGSPEIKQSLESLKRGGIPLLAIFPAGKPPILLDALISKQQVLDALRQAGPSNPIDGEADGKSLTASTAPR
jgi:thiol:disulfide interchange protein